MTKIDCAHGPSDSCDTDCMYQGSRLKWEDDMFQEILTDRGFRFLFAVKRELDEEGGDWAFEGFVSKPTGNEPEEPENLDAGRLRVWIHQTLNGGYNGDDYAGTFDIEIFPGQKYARFSYSM